MPNPKPYYYFEYNDLSDDIGYKSLVFNQLTKKLGHLIKIDLNNEQDINRSSIFLQMLINSVDLASRWNNLQSYTERLEVALDIIDLAFKKESKEVCEMYAEVASALTEYEEEIHYSKNYYNETMQGEDIPIKKFKAMFDYYLDLYKENYSIVSSFPAFCLDLIGNKVDPTKTKKDYLNIESKEKVEKLSSPLILKKYPINSLIIGCERHIRNALSHENKHTFIEDGKKVRLIDINLKGETIFDKIFTVKEFEKVLVDLMITVLSMRSAVILFNVNENQTITKLLPKPSYTPKEIEKIAFVSAKDSCLDYQSMNFVDNETIYFVVKEQGRRKSNYIIQVGPFSSKVSIPALPPTPQQLARFLQMVYLTTGKKFKRMGVTLLNTNSKEVGLLETDTDNFSHKDVKKFLKNAIKNTIPNNYQL